MCYLLHFSFFCKQQVYKQLALGWQIARQRSKLDSLLLINNRDYILRKVMFFLCNKRKTVVKPTMHQDLAISKVLLSLLLYFFSIRVFFHRH